MKVLVHDRLDAIGPAAWKALHSATALRSPFLSWAWQAEWSHAFVQGRPLEIWQVDDDSDGLIALLPLYEATPGTFELVGGADVSDYLDLLAVQGRETAAWTALLQARADSDARWSLHAVSARSPSVTALPALAASSGLTATARVEERCPVLTLPASWNEYLAGLSGKDRHEITRKIRRLEREIPDARVAWAATPDEVAARFDDFLDLHRRSRAGKARFMDARMEKFFRAVITAMAANRMARLTFLDTRSGPIAGFITMEWNSTVGLYNSGFHPDRAALAPGLVLLANLIREAIERGARRFDFLRGEERYKYEFGPTPEEVYAISITPGTRVSP